MNRQSLLCLGSAFVDFYQFAPKQQLTILVLMLLQGITAGIGLLFIIPLLQLVGFDFGAATANPAATLAPALFELLAVEPTLVAVLCSYIVIVSLVATFRYQLSVRSVRLQQRYISHLRNRLYRALLHSHWQFITQNKMSDFSHRLSGQVQSIGHACSLMLTLVSQTILILVMVCLSLVMSWQMTLLALGFAGVLLLLLLPFNRLIYGSGAKQLSSYKTIFQMLTEQLASLKMIKSYASEAYYADQLQQVSATLEQQQVRMTSLNAITQWVSLVATVTAFSFFFYWAQSTLTIALTTLLLLLFIFSRLLPQITGLHKTYQQLLHKVPAFYDVTEMLAACKQAQEPHKITVQCPLLTKEIRLEKISFCYPNKAKPVIENFSYRIVINQTVALVGASGAGKSTLADLIAGLLVPQQGEIYCDAVALEEEQRLAWREKVAYVTQEVYLFHDSIRANLSWVAREKVSDADLWHVLKLAAADDFVAALPNGLDTFIGDRGIRLSGGERQRLAIARALLSSPQLLILDEATSALDHHNEQKIQQALLQLHGKLTILIIAHRETTIRHVDSTINLNTKEQYG